MFMFFITNIWSVKQPWEPAQLDCCWIPLKNY